MTVDLNAGEYDGGELRFHEYGEQLYAIERGTAIVWSASLLHEVLPVTKGRRLVLGVHMFAGSATEQRRSNFSSSCAIEASINVR